MICILPETQEEKDGIPPIYQAVAIASVSWFIKLRESAEAVSTILTRVQLAEVTANS